MKLPLALLGVLLAAAALGAAQESATPNSRVVEQLRNLERSKFDALQRKDDATLDAILDEGLIWVSPDGSLWTKADYLAKLHNPNWQLLQVSTESMALQVHGDIAIVVGIYHERGMRSGHPYVERCRFIDTWVLTKGKWMCIAAAATSAIA